MNPDLAPKEFLTEFLLEQIAAQPESRRVLLYRALAADTADQALRDDCRRRACEIEEQLRNESQMLLNFRQRLQPQPRATRATASGRRI